MKQWMGKRMGSLLLVLCLLIGALPVGVVAEEEQPQVDSEGYSLIWSYDQLRTVAQTAKYQVRYRLATDIVQTDSENNLGIEVEDGAHFSLDLNGHTLSRKTASLDSALFIVRSWATLDIYDSSPEQTGSCIFDVSYAPGTCSVIQNSGGTVTVNGGRYIIKGETISYYAVVLYGESGEITVYDGYFDATEAKGGTAVELFHMAYMYDLPTCLIYGGEFHSKENCIDVAAYGNYAKYGVYFPYVFVMGGEFYTKGTKYSDGDFEGHFAYCNNRWGRVIVANGLVPATSLNAPDQRYATGTTKRLEKLTGEPGNGWTYATVTPSPRIVSRQMPLEDRLYSLCWKDYLKTAKENESYAFWSAYQEKIQEELDHIDGFTVNKYDTEPTVLTLEDQGEMETVRWYFSDSPDSRWSELGDYRDSTGPVPLNRPDQESTLYYRVVVTHKDGSEYEDIIYVHHQEPVKTIGGKAVVRMNSAAYGNTAQALVLNAPAGQDASTYTYEWTINGRTVGTEKQFNIDKASYVGQRLNCTVRSTAYEGSLVTPNVTVGKGQNTEWPVFHTAEFANGYIAITNAQIDQEYLFTTKPSVDVLTQEDWEKAHQINATSGVGTFSLPYLGLESEEGKTIYVYTRFEETATHLAGEKVLCTRLTLADVVPLTTLRFEDAVNDTLYIPFTGAGDTVEISYELDPINANQWNAFTWRTSYPVSLVEPTGSVTTSNNTGIVKLKLITTGTTTLTASYITNTEQVYKRVNIVVYDPENPSVGSANVLYPMPDQTVMTDTVFLPQMPELYPTPPEDTAFSWTFVRRVGFSEERVTDTDVASIDPVTGAITAKAVGQVDVALIGPGGAAVDTFLLTVIENDGTVAVESVQLSHETLSMQVKDRVTLTAMVYPINADDQMVVWESSDPSVATVDENGVVTALRAGTAQITAQVGGITATCTVAVEKDIFSAAVGLLGDVNGDTKVDAKDALEVLKAAVGKVELTDAQKLVAEVDGQEGINAKDALQILKYAVKKIEKFPIEG